MAPLVHLLLLACASAAASSNTSAGILYEVWHSHAAQNYAAIAAQNGTQLTTELVVQSAGALTLDDVLTPFNLSGDIYNAQPQGGFYCLYRSRPGDPTPAPLPDCANITTTATRHASLLTSAGLDYIAVDWTNWPIADVGGSTDTAILRPTEVLFEEWVALRSQGIPTPAIAVWPCSPAGSTTWQWALNRLYNNATFAPLVYTQNGKKVYFVPYTSTCYDPATVALIENNFGRNDVTVVPVWALFGQQAYTEGVYGFFAPCTDPNGDYTSSMVGDNVGPCNQFATTANTTGGPVIEVSASGGYMLSQCALPFASPGHMRGLTVARLFEKVLATKAPNLFMSSFNEFIGGRQAPASGAKIAFNMGLPHDRQRDQVWVDTYAAEFSRDIEPTVEGGSRVWEVASACIQLYKAGQTCDDAPTSACCTRADKEVFGNIWSLARKDGGDFLLTQLVGERDVLVASGVWEESCSPIPNPTAFCVNGGDPDGRSGPFILYNTSGTGPFPTVPLYRCINTGGVHFFSTDAQCEALGTAESVLGYISTRPGRETLRALRRCKGATAGTIHHALDLECDTPDGDGAPLGYVR
jgi:hypothetical protein